MCHNCGEGLMATKDGSKKKEDERSLNINIGVPIGPCKSCEEKQELQHVRMEVPSAYVTPMLSPTTSLSSIDRSYSSCSEFSVDLYSFDRIQEQDLLDGGREDDLNHNNSENVQKYNGQEAKVNGIKISDAIEQNDGTNLAEFDLQIWEPPDPEDPQDDADDSVSYNDDDSEVIYGMKWGKSASVSVSRNEQFKSCCFKEFKQRMMEEVMNGKFKATVSQLLESVYVSTSDEHGTSWVDIVTSLSWEAAASIKHAAIAGDVIDPDGLVKVKCIATGSCNQSQIINGLVFKKHAAHKHMPTKLKNPRLLLIKGMLGSSGLSSFNYMEQEKEYLKSIFELIEMCHPNVILVEKTVSRDIQELVLQKGMALVLDMKLHRLERVARCTGSQILSCDNIKSQNLAQCDSVYFEKFVEEHASLGEGGKRPTKTFMFIEGCPTRLGCTILLKGTNSDELKRIKCVLRCAVVMAYHLILETSFLLDQNAMFSSTAFAKVVDLLPNNQCDDLVKTAEVPSIKDLNTETGFSVVDIPISDGIHDGSVDSVEIETEPNSCHAFESYNPATFSGFSSMSSSLKKVIKDSFPTSSSPSYKSLSSYFGFNGREKNDESTKAVSVLDVSVADENYNEEKNCADEENSVNARLSQPLSISSEDHLEMRQANISKIDSADNRDDRNAALDSQSILVLMSSRNSSRGTMCTQSHFSHIMFYKKFDIPLGKFLLDNLFTQVRYCMTCGELPEAHFYYYAHCNKQLTIQVKRLPPDKCLPGEAEGKIWMWCRCGKCKSSSGLPKSTKRVSMSSATCNLSFGKFLELSLSNYFSSDRKSSCGHSLDRDFLYFFGLGFMVAMFQYSTVATFTIALPPEKLEFGRTVKQESPHAETENVYAKAIILFTEVECCLKKIKDQFSSSTSNNGESIKKLHDAQELLKEEKTFFEINIKNVVASNQNMESVAYMLLSINGLMWELLTESCIWEMRLHSILSHGTSKETSHAHVAESIAQEQFGMKDKVSSIGNTGYLNTLAKSNNVDSPDVNDKSDATADNGELITKEVLINDPEDEFKELGHVSDAPLILRKHEVPTLENLIPQRFYDVEFSSGPDESTCTLSRYNSAQSDDSVLFDNVQVSGSTPVIAATGNSPNAANKQPNRSALLHLPEPDLHSSNEWFWKPFPLIRQIVIKDIKKNFLPTFECSSSHNQQCLPITNQLVNEEASRLYIPLRNENFVVSDYEGELSSIIACALALIDSPVKSEDQNEDNRGDSGVIDTSSGLDSSHGLSCKSDITSNIFSPDSSGSEKTHSRSVSSEEVHVSRAPEIHSIEHNSIAVPLGYSQPIWKEKYLVICHYANQFCELRNRCCPSELDYIASLSRCRNWDAKGGKSKSFFAKTLDDRLIIKEIKKTEFDSFRGFAPLYFKYMKDSFGTGSQTCLAKVLGIYQVIKRPTKSAKEAKHDLIVMENLTYNRKISRQYDLKGALYARFNTTDAAGEVLLDQNFVNDMNSSPLYVSQKAKRYLQRAVWNDTTFLNSVNVMDYSLLVGVDSERRELVCGIIDYIRQYTWDKHLETWMKTSLAPKNILPTVISPKEYKKRFRKFMATHFLSVPDNWCSMESIEPCKRCSREDDDSAHQNPQSKAD